MPAGSNPALAYRAPIAHPLGRGAGRHEDHHTPNNREAVAICLYRHFDGSLAPRINKGRGSSALTGAALADRMVSDLEIASALGRLAAARPDLAQLVELKYRDGLTKRQIGTLTRHSPATITRWLDDALNYLIDWIFYDDAR